MTTNNSGDVRKYDGQPMPKTQSAQFDESLDDIAMSEDVEQPIKEFPRSNSYSSIVLAPNYAIQKNKG